MKTSQQKATEFLKEKMVGMQNRVPAFRREETQKWRQKKSFGKDVNKYKI